MEVIKLNRQEKRVREELIDIASRKGRTTYQNLSDITGLELDMQDPDHRERMAKYYAIYRDLSICKKTKQTKDPFFPLLF